MLRKLTVGLLAAAALGGAGATTALAATPHHAEPAAAVVRERASLDRVSSKDRAASASATRDRSGKDSGSSERMSRR
jgi:hypothetical protein